MDSDLHHHHHPQQQQLSDSGLTRYRSAPSSYFSNLINSGIHGDEDIDPFFNPRASSPETERILSRFMSGVGGGGGNSSSHQNPGQTGGNEPQFMDSLKQEQVTFSSQQQQQMIYRNQAESQHGNHDNNPVVSSSSSAMYDPLMAMNTPTNLLRQSSSPAGFFAHINTDNGYSVMRSMDNYGAGSGAVPDSSFSSAKRLKSQMAFSSGSHSTSRLLSRIPENEGKTVERDGAHNDGGFGETHSKAGGYVASFASASWDEQLILTDGFLKELGESDRNTFSSLNSSENQNDEGRMRAPTALTHHLSLPTSSAELSAMDKLLQFEDSVPLRSRAKRGCATHPRSIAERVRRTRISERMRKLQELVPNMDKQTSTADMLDLAVDYIKELQKKVETLSDHRGKCTCPHKEEFTQA